MTIPAAVIAISMFFSSCNTYTYEYDSVAGCCLLRATVYGSASETIGIIQDITFGEIKEVTILITFEPDKGGRFKDGEPINRLPPNPLILILSNPHNETPVCK